MSQRNSVARAFGVVLLLVGTATACQSPALWARLRKEIKSAPPVATAPGKVVPSDGKGVFKPDWLDDPLFRASEALVSWWPADGHALDLAGILHGKRKQHVVFDKGCKGAAFSFPKGKGFVSIHWPPAKLVDTFTMAVWVYPSATSQLGKPHAYKYAGTRGQRYAIHPGYSDRNRKQASCGISVGTNGVGVFEHIYDNLPCVLTHIPPIKGWTTQQQTFAD